MANLHRGEIDFPLEGEIRPLRLTLGGLAELESAFGADGLAALGARLSEGRLSAGDALAV
ncbi:MAG: GTA-gp10 family protein, partial [Beijerinckiaceae bacterium]